MGQKKDGRSRLNKTLMSNTQTVSCGFYVAKGRCHSSLNLFLSSGGFRTVLRIEPILEALAFVSVH